MRGDSHHVNPLDFGDVYLPAGLRLKSRRCLVRGLVRHTPDMPG